MNRVTKRFGKDLFTRMENIINYNETHKIQMCTMRSVLASLFHKLAQDKEPSKHDLYHHQIAFFRECRYEGVIESKSHELRKMFNNCVHDEAVHSITKETIVFNPSEHDYKKSIRSLADIISHFSEFDIPESILSLFKDDNNGTKNTTKLKEDDLFDNPEPRIPVVMVLDTSSSMLIKDNGKDSRIDILNNGIRQFFRDVIEDERTRDSVEVCIVTFDETIKKISDFGRPEKQTIYNLKAEGKNTHIGQGVIKALEILEDRKREYQDSGVEYYQPWLVLMTDGFPTEDISIASKQTCELVRQQKLTIFPVGISSGADLTTLNLFSPKRPALRLKNYHFREFFEWLHKSAIRVSESSPGMEGTDKLHPKKDWFEK